MSAPILATKLYISPLRPNIVPRPRLIARLNEGLHGKLTLISAPAGFGKTTLLAEWIANCKLQIVDYNNPNLQSAIYNLQSVKVAWLSLDEGDNDPARFLAYLVAALQTIAANIGAGVLGVLQTPQPPPIEVILTALLNDIATIPDNFVLVLDDYHVLDAKPIDTALAFLIEHLPPQLHLVITTREDPQLPLARLRARGQLTELRATDLRFTLAEAAGFLKEVMGLNLSAEDIAALEERTEGWIAGLQLAAISMQGHQDAASFIRSFTGSHHFVLDYLVEEVLHQQSASVQTFLLRTSILDRMCGPLCDALLDERPKTKDESSTSSFVLRPSSFVLEELEHANLFIVPLDNERRWFRYHHLFADLLRQRLHQSTASSTGDAERGVAELHIRASIWYEDNRLEIEAFHHAAAANDIARAARLIEGAGMPLHFRGAVAPVLNWLESLPTAVLDARPSLWVIYASALLFVGQLAGVEQKVQAAEAALQGTEPDDKTKDLVGHIAAIRATLAVSQQQVETIITQSRRALEYLHPDNLPVRTATTWTLGLAYQLQGDRAAASRAYTEALSISQAIGHFIITIMATIGLGNLQEADNQLYLASETYQRVLQLVGDPPPLVVCEAHLGLARIYYEWNDLDVAQQHAQQSLQLARQIENTDRFVASEVFMARLKLAQGDAVGAAIILAQADQDARQHNFVYQTPEIAAAQVRTLLHQGNLAAAAHLAEKHKLRISRARVYLAQGDPAAALAVLEPLCRQVEAKGWADERLKVMVLQAVAHHAHGEKAKAAQLLDGALALAGPGGFIRIFVDEGIPVAVLLAQSAERRAQDDPISVYVERLLSAFPAEQRPAHLSAKDASSVPRSALECSNVLVEPLSQRELEVLQLIALGLSNHEISERLFLALDTVKGHNRRIYGKLQVQRRTEAVAKARSLNLLPHNNENNTSNQH
jgi:LuxR family transcriptional regulator, maltose regulon positive regulatory protein